MSTDRSPVLELSTLAPERPEILLRWSGEKSGKLYEMVEIDDLSLEQQADLAKYTDIMQSLRKKSDASLITPPEAKKLAEAIGKLVKYLLPGLEDQAFAELTDGAKVKIIEAFTLASPEMSKLVEAEKRKTKAKTSA